MRDILPSVRSPFRYIGGEVGARAKSWDAADVRICLAFPEVYELGMSHLGLAILYHIINDQPRMLADRVFAPWHDMEAELSRCNVPLFALESERPLSEFDIIGFSLGYELTYTNVLNMLKLSGIPLRSEERSRVSGLESQVPVIIAGGPCTFNPMPMSPFFDAMVIGDGEGAIIGIANAVAEWKGSDVPRLALLKKLATIKGVYVPLIRDSSPGKAHVSDLDSAPFPGVPLVPHAATQERVAVEVARGCARGCRFCQAGYIYRPVRQRSAARAAGLACDGLMATGNEDFSFLSLSIGDWPPLTEALLSVHDGIGGLPVNASLPSLRAESLTQPVIDALGRARSGSFTLAPEAGSERMRRFINKGNTDDDLYASAEKVFKSGWHAIKLYFMIGLPGETPDDIEGIIRISNRCLDIGRRHCRRPEVTVSTSTFVPKAHTPFQWERQISIDEAQAIQGELKRRLRRPGLFYRWHDAGMSFLEGVFARGGPEIARAVELAHEKGARLDGWEEFFDLARWREAFAEAGVAPEACLEARDTDAALTWDHLGVGPSREFLIREREKAHALEPTEDCTIGKCSACGVCDFEEVKNRIVDSTGTRFETLRGVTPPGEAGEGNRRASGGEGVSPSEVASQGGVTPKQRYRFRYRKIGRAAFLGSIEALDAIRRALRASGLKLNYSEGFHPRAKISAGPALPVGIESEAEFIDVEICGGADPADIMSRLAGRLPDGMEIAEAGALAPPYSSIEGSIASTNYEVYLQGGSVIRVSILNAKPLKKIKDVLAEEHGLDGDALKSAIIRKVGIEWRTNS
ncbi:MAG: TIGR03960 family B12-binding radical SAM protein [Pseudomonadota bacterium]